MLIVQSSSNEVYRNLAIEEYLMEQVVDCGPVLFLWRSDCAVVMGKNQNPWRECRLDVMREEGVPLARRISGGGTVYHDAGSLNFCVSVDRSLYQEAQAYEMVFRALETFGIQAKKTGKSNLSVDGLKFSGNAFSFRKGCALHHGTLLLNTNLERLNRYLGSMFDSIETHAIRSEPAEVTNLNLGVAEVSAALQDSFESLYGIGKASLLPGSSFEKSVLDALIQKQISNDWKYGATPKFTLDWNHLHLGVEKGMVVFAKGEHSERFLNTNFADTAFSLPCDVD
jgi:lipoate-protein ligase A